MYFLDKVKVFLLVLFHDSNPSGPLVQILMYFRIHCGYNFDFDAMELSSVVSLTPQSQTRWCQCSVNKNKNKNVLQFKEATPRNFIIQTNLDPNVWSFFVCTLYSTAGSKF